MPGQKTSYGRDARIDGPHAQGQDRAEILGTEHVRDLGPEPRVDHPAQAALASSSVFELRDLRVCCEGEQVLISGSVQCFYHKQLAQETVRQHAPHLRLINQVSVERLASEPL